ncbi:uncharacterized protein B0H64DRAFT_169187 [Chaetomium fimeti]|uniref:Uncharacterized protein n=1 Tax=Chaetomium fimeti TaxID=1854472 RepID=A0AAE0LSY5_9PEZI|nr:hypothetical protein B0H64DRAFT_169187 [Chaetomium fimeti]
MSGPPCARETHHLKIDIDFDRILTMIFPHTSWADSFMDHLESRPYHQDCRARLDDAYTVSMKLPKNVDRMHIGLSTSANEGGAIALVFDDKRCARDWLANSPLWEAPWAGPANGERSAVIRTRWAHGDFEERMGMHRGTQANAHVPPGTVPVGAPTARRAHVIGLAEDRYSRDPSPLPGMNPLAGMNPFAGKKPFRSP